MNNYEMDMEFNGEDGDGYIKVLIKVFTTRPHYSLKKKFETSVGLFKEQNEWTNEDEKNWGHSWDTGMKTLFHKYLNYIKIDYLAEPY
mgnify:CR=1 FL=1